MSESVNTRLMVPLFAGIVDKQGEDGDMSKHDFISPGSSDNWNKA